MRCALSLMAVTALGGAASADTATPIAVVAAPRALPSGAPACGNVMAKSFVDPLCPVLRNLRELEALGRKYDAALGNSGVKTASLTVRAPPRPRP